MAYTRSLLDGMSVPGDSGRLEAFIKPPDPETEQRTPHAYVWSARGDERRSSGPRSAAPSGAPQYVPAMPAGWKYMQHSLEIYLVWFDDQTDAQADSTFPFLVDAVMNALRTTKMPVPIVDPSTGLNTQIVDLGRSMTYEYSPLKATAAQRIDRFDAMILAPVQEWIQA